MSLPEIFTDRLQLIMPQAEKEEGATSFFKSDQRVCMRINTLKMEPMEIFDQMDGFKIEYFKPSWSAISFWINRQFLDLSIWDEWFQQGFVYRQSLSSQLAPIILDPQPGERVLDLCSAPGSKSTQMAAMMKNAGYLICNEIVKSRLFKLKAVVEILGAENITFRMQDGRRYRGEKLWGEGEQFDRILVDAPCSSEGRFCVDDPKSYEYWSLRKIKEMKQKQRGLLMSAFRLLRSRGILVYSTCTFAPEENEGVVDWLLRKTKGQAEVVPIEIDQVKRYPAVLSWGKKVFDPSVKNCLRVFPEKPMDGFFICKIQKR